MMPARSYNYCHPLIDLRSVRVAFARHWLEMRRPVPSATGGNLPRQERLYARLELSNGTEGFGEAAPHPTRGPDVEEVETEAIQWLRDPPSGGVMDQTVLASAPPILQMALIDALARQRSLPAWKFLELPEPPPIVRTLVTYGGSPEALREQIKLERPYAIKLKLLGNEADLARIASVAANFEGPVALDANAAWADVNKASRSIARIEEVLGHACPLLWVEQPCPPGAMTSRLHTNFPVYADEGATHPAFDWSVYDGIVIKPAASAVCRRTPERGLLHCIALARSALAHGKTAVLGCHLQSSLMTTATFALAGLCRAAIHDLDSPFLLAHDPAEPSIIINPSTCTLSAPEGTGFASQPCGQSIIWPPTHSTKTLV